MYLKFPTRDITFIEYLTIYYSRKREFERDRESHGGVSTSILINIETLYFL